MTLLSGPSTVSETTTLLSKSSTKLLCRSEQFWAQSYHLLLSHGYQLRSRYNPQWVPSWHSKRDPIWHECDDFLISFKTNALDALRINDSKKVVLKRVNQDELAIFRHLDDCRADTRNHTIPLLDVIPFPGTEWTFVVMPYCRRFTSPPFHCRDEFVDAMTQYIEGLQFMHEHNVVHFDIAPQNMVMEESRLIPKGSHWFDPNTHHGFGHFFSWRNRCSLRPSVQYYYIDFGLSMHFPAGKESARAAMTLRTFPMIPELSLTVPYNPFYVDIFQLGLAMRRIIDDYPALEDFRIVAAGLTVEDPHARATLEASLRLLNAVRDGMAPSLRGKRIWEKGATRWRKLTRVVFGGHWSD
ncbi:hypothetical protein C8R47DRAFT_1081083 [Mycena vitilis]|nr:hypothetical protein C8R47DRAFT_1081083 [Mycena vitilis]